jgi:hypothetical protein
VSELIVEIPVSGSKNAVIKAFGVLTGNLPLQELISFEKLGCEKLKIESLTFAIQEKLGFQLGWRVGEDVRSILPLESRGYLNWASVFSLHSPKGANGIMIESFGWTGPSKSFLFELDLEKQ